MELATSEVKSHIHLIRGLHVMMDSDLAVLFQTKTKALNQTVSRNNERFPEDFSFPLTREEYETLRSQIVTLRNLAHGQHRKYLPRVFTEHAVLILSSILNTDRAIQVSIASARAFTQLRSQKDSSNHVHSLQVNALLGKIDKIDLKLEHTISELRVLTKQSKEPINQATPQISEIAYCKGGHSDEHQVKRIYSIQSAVVKKFGINASDLSSAKREQRIVLPRQITIYLIRKHLGISFKEIGQVFGGRNHATLIHAVERISTKIKLNQAIGSTVVEVERSLGFESN